MAVAQRWGARLGVPVGSPSDHRGDRDFEGGRRSHTIDRSSAPRAAARARSSRPRYVPSCTRPAAGPPTQQPAARASLPRRSAALLHNLGLGHGGNVTAAYVRVGRRQWITCVNQHAQLGRRSNCVIALHLERWVTCLFWHRVIERLHLGWLVPFWQPRWVRVKLGTLPYEGDARAPNKQAQQCEPADRGPDDDLRVVRNKRRSAS